MIYQTNLKRVNLFMHNKNKKYDIYTHDGLFHPDEIFAICLLKMFYCDINNIHRTRDPLLLSKAYEEPDSILVDVGEKYNCEQLAFDHHQKEMDLYWDDYEYLYNMFVPLSSTGLVFKFLKDNGYMDLSDDVINNILIKWVIPIDAADNGIIDFEKNAFIFSFNRIFDDANMQFNKALKATYQLLENIIYNEIEQEAINIETEYYVSNKEKIIVNDKKYYFVFYNNLRFNPDYAKLIDSNIDFHISCTNNSFFVRSFEKKELDNNGFRSYKHLVPDNIFNVDKSKLSKMINGEVVFIHKNRFAFRINGEKESVINFIKLIIENKK